MFRTFIFVFAVIMMIAAKLEDNKAVYAGTVKHYGIDTEIINGEKHTEKFVTFKFDKIDIQPVKIVVDDRTYDKAKAGENRMFFEFDGSKYEFPYLNYLFCFGMFLVIAVILSLFFMVEV